MGLPDIPTSRINKMIDAVNRRYPKDTYSDMTPEEEAWYDSLWRSAEEYAAKYGGWPVYEMGEIESDDPVLDIYGDG